MAMFCASLAPTASFTHAKHRCPLAHVGDIGAGPMLRTGHLGGELVGREPRVQLEPAQVVPEYVGAPVLARQAHPHDLVEAAWAA